MPHAYEGPADIVVSATIFGREPVEVLSPGVQIILRPHGPGVVHMEFPAQLAAPESANHVRVLLPDGKWLEGSLVHGEITGPSGWLTFNVERSEGLAETSL